MLFRAVILLTPIATTYGGLSSSSWSSYLQASERIKEIRVLNVAKLNKLR